MDREQAIERVKQAYAARAAGDTDALARFFTEDAEFRIAGDPARVEKVALGDGAPPMQTLSALIARFNFADVTLLDAIFEGRRLAMRWRVTATAAGHPPVSTELLDLVTLSDDGRIASLVQFADTALIRALAS